MDRSYGILFSEYVMEGYCVQDKLICLESLRRELGVHFTNPDLQFDIVKVVAHSEDNAYPEIGVHSISGDISDQEFEEIEKFVIGKTKEVVPSVVVLSLPSLEAPTWESICESGSFPNRMQTARTGTALKVHIQHVQYLPSYSQKE